MWLLCFLTEKESSESIPTSSWDQNKSVRCQRRRAQYFSVCCFKHTAARCRWGHVDVRKPQCENACGRLNTLQNMAISTGHSQRAGGSGWLHPADHKTTTPADNLCTSADSCKHTLRIRPQSGHLTCFCSRVNDFVIDFTDFRKNFLKQHHFKSPSDASRTHYFPHFICLQVTFTQQCRGESRQKGQRSSQQCGDTVWPVEIRWGKLLGPMCVCVCVGHKYSCGIPSLWPTWLLSSKHFSREKCVCVCVIWYFYLCERF